MKWLITTLTTTTKKYLNIWINISSFDCSKVQIRFKKKFNIRAFASAKEFEKYLLILKYSLRIAHKEKLVITPASPLIENLIRIIVII